MLHVQNASVIDPQVKIFTYSELVNILNDSTLNDIFQLQV
jgi:hypothetical protein